MYIPTCNNAISYYYVKCTCHHEIGDMILLTPNILSS